MSSPTSDDTPVTAVAVFLNALTTSGELVVPVFDSSSVVFDNHCCALVTQRDADVRTELALALPRLDMSAVEWAARTFFHACQFLVCREVAEATIASILAKPCPGKRDASTDYSVDLIFQFLPDLHAIASRSGPSDPLVGALMRLAREWPLSSVGIPLGAPPAEITFAADASLLRIYTDRVTERVAKDRLNSAALGQVLRTDAGLFSDIIPFPASSYSHD